MQSNIRTVNLSREEINQLPLRRYDGPIHLVRSEQDLSDVLPMLSQEVLLGFDTETRPCFKKGDVRQPALVQLASEKAVYIFQLRSLGFSKDLIKILSDPKIIKAGVAHDYDLRELKKLAAFKAAGFVELSKLASECGMKHQGLRGLAACLLGFRLSKRLKTSNWERSILTASQLKYAATDAWVGREIYLALQNDT